MTPTPNQPNTHTPHPNPAKAATRPNPTKAQAKRIIMEMCDWLNTNGYYFTCTEDQYRSVWVCLTYRDVTVSEVRQHLLPQHMEHIMEIIPITRSVTYGTGFSYVEIVIIKQ